MTVIWYKLGIPFGPDYDIGPDGKPEFMNSGEADSVCARRLNKPGVLLRLAANRFYKEKLVLIGHVNASNGGCGCCSGIDSDCIVTEYAIVWEEEA